MKKAAFILFGLALTIAACTRDGMPTKEFVLSDNDKGFGVDFGMLESVNADAEMIAEKAFYNDTASFNGCKPVILRDTINRILVIDFGAECKDISNLNRKGRIIVSYTRSYRDSGSVRRVTYDNYHYNGNRLAGYKILEHRGPNLQGRPYCSVVISDTLYIGSAGGNITRLYEGARAWTAGYETPGMAGDDAFEIKGSGSLKRENNSFVDFNILSELIVSADCKYVRSGSMQVIPRDGAARTINYGSGNCDENATIEVSGRVFDVKL